MRQPEKFTPTRKKPLRTVVLPSIGRDHYAEIAALAKGMHATWTAWKREITAFEMSAQRQGHRLQYVPILPAELAAWAAAHVKGDLTADHVTKYASVMASRK